LPQPKVSFWWKVLEFLGQLISGIVLVYVSLLILVAILKEFLAMPEIQSGMVALGLLVIALWLLWTMTPHWIRKLILRLIKRKHERNGRG
jgi:Co/Zn/Cd efflux system component